MLPRLLPPCLRGCCHPVDKSLPIWQPKRTTNGVTDMTGHDDLNDPLDELFRSAADTATRPAKPVPPAHFVPAVERAFTEACSRCGGSGFWAYGRVCFKCSGDGKQVFKTSADDREKARNRASRSEEHPFELQSLRHLACR